MACLIASQRPPDHSSLAFLQGNVEGCEGPHQDCHEE